MKEGLHPTYETTTYICSCGNRFETKSTHGGDVRIELCNECHPFFTGQQKLIDTGGRVQRFSDKFGAAAATTLEREKKVAEANRIATEAAEAEKKVAREVKAAEKAKKAAEYEAAAPAPAPEAPAEEAVAPAEAPVAEEAPAAE
ncbi:MAG: 50S ribosomal protein L31 [Coriobacteriia bacterium]|nr:50S ribosomal protein L31 [Coriobacteriia bacterium]